MFIPLLWIPISLAVLGQVSGKIGALHIVESGTWRAMVNPFTLAAYACLLLRSGSWLVVLRRVPVSVAYPMMSLTYVIVTLVGWWRFDETMTAGKVGGSLLILAGVSLIPRTGKTRQAGYADTVAAEKATEACVPATGPQPEDKRQPRRALLTTENTP